MRRTVTVSVAHNYIRVYDYSEEFIQRVILPFCRMHLYKTAKVPIPGTGQTKWIVSHAFARFNHAKTEFRICRELLDPFLKHAEQQNYHRKRFLIVDEPELVGVPVQFKWREGWGSPRDEQVEWTDYQLAPGPLKVNNGRPGFGKTFCATHTMVNTGVRTVVTIQPRYIPVWLKDLPNSVELGPDDLIVAECDLVKIAENIKKGLLNPKVIIVPMTRIEVHLRKMKEDPDLPTMDDIYRDMGVGLRIMDEAHEAIHQIYMSFLFGNFPKTLALSGTLKGDDEFNNKVYRWLYPKQHRLKETEHKQYVDIIAYHYNLDVRKYRVNFMSFGSYSDVTFEKCIIRNNKLMNFYFQLAKKAFDEFYMPRRREGTKAVFFYSKVDMCERICAMLKQAYPDLDVITFTGEQSKKADTRDEYRKHEVVITTPGSCGTGKDIPGLINVFCWHTVASMQRNDQILLRLRDISKTFPDLDPQFLYGICLDIPKHRDYHNKRKSLFESKAKRQRLINSDMIMN